MVESSPTSEGLDELERTRAELRRTQEALRATQDLLHAAVEGNPSAVFIKDPQGRYLLANSAGARVVGKTVQEIIGREDTAVLPAEVAERMRASDRRVLATGEPEVCEETFSIGGARRTFLTTKTLYRDSAGHTLGVIGMSRDITERKEATESLRRGQQFLRAVIDNTPECIKLVAPDGTLVDINPAGLAMLDAEAPGEVLGQSVYALITPEYREAYRALHERVCRGEKGQLVFEIVGLKGTRRWMETYAAPLRNPSDGRLLQLGLSHDITERKRAEEAVRASERRFRALVENSWDLLTLLAPDGTIIYISPASLKQRSYTEEELIGQNGLDFIHPEDQARIAGLLKQVVSEPGAVVSAELRALGKDGTWRWTEASARNMLHEPGIGAIVVNYRDITERKLAEEARTRAEAHLRQAQKMEAIGRLAGGVAHDFNNLLTIINGYSEFLLGRLPAGDPARDAAREIHKAGGRAATLTRQLLAFSRRQILAPVVLDLNAILTGMEKVLRSLIGEDIEFRTCLAADLGRVKADAGQMEQVLVALALNARDAMPKGGELTIETRNAELDEVHVQAHPEARPGSYALLLVRDTGVGMDAETRAHLFEPFFTTKEFGKGSGMGLAMVYGTVSQSGGHIEVQSEPGHGTTFAIYLPRLPELAPAPESGSGLRRLPQGHETVLLVEDEDGVRMLARLVLQTNGYTVLEARNGRDALTVAERHAGPIHLLVSDVVMPQMSGREVADRLRAVRPGLRVLYISGYADDAIVHHGVLEPGLAFLQKPFSPAVLVRKVREVLDANPINHG
jgi:PAS domain S-box-containing protein